MKGSAVTARYAVARERAAIVGLQLDLLNVEAPSHLADRRRRSLRHDRERAS